MSGKISLNVQGGISGGGSVRLAEHFLYAGISALLLSIPHLHPQLWSISCFALVPFLWRVARIRFIESLILGVMLAVSYCFAVFAPALWISSPEIFVKLSAFCVLFALYAGAVNRIARHLGMNVIFIAVLWLPLEHLLNSAVKIGGILAVPAGETGIVFRIGTLFGMLVVSFLVVAANLVVLALVKQLVKALKVRPDVKSGSFVRYYNPGGLSINQRLRYYFIIPRAPPGISG